MDAGTEQALKLIARMIARRVLADKRVGKGNSPMTGDLPAEKHNGDKEGSDA